MVGYVHYVQVNFIDFSESNIFVYFSWKKIVSKELRSFLSSEIQCWFARLFLCFKLLQIFIVLFSQIANLFQISLKDRKINFVPLLLSKIVSHHKYYPFLMFLSSSFWKRFKKFYAWCYKRMPKLLISSTDNRYILNNYRVMKRISIKNNIFHYLQKWTIDKILNLSQDPVNN